MLKLVAVVLALGVVSVLAEENVPTVTISHGNLRGKYEQTRQGRTFTAFTGIPYAKAPVGELRFKPPQAAEKWKGTLDATKPHAICPQLNVLFSDFTAKGKEDCLFLNVFVPLKSKFESGNLPVMFYIHGGGFLMGEANAKYHGPKYILDEDVVLVTVNYRLGPLGFLSTGDDVVPGNNGLKDQNFALKWVKNNIVKFGGNPDKITIFGESAGAGSVHHHILSPLSRNLIVGGIAQSGNALAPWAISTNGENEDNTRKLSQLLNCPIEDSKAMIECLRKIEAKKIIEQETQFYEFSYDPAIPFKPVIEGKVEGAFITEEPLQAIKSGKSGHIPFITGITSHEGVLKSSVFFTDPKLTKLLKIDIDRVIKTVILGNKKIPGLENLIKSIKKFYFDNNTDYEHKVFEFTDMVSDSWFVMSAEDSILSHAKYSKAPSYYYSFDYRGTDSFAPLFAGKATQDFGVSHCDDLIYLFSSDIFPIRDSNTSDYKISEIMVKLWTNFAKTGNPTPETDTTFLSKKWKAVNPDHFEYYSIKKENNFGMSENKYATRTQFWRNLFSKNNNGRDEL